MQILKHFENIVKIPHCSFEAQKLKDYIINYAKEQNCEVLCDEAENILCKKGKANLCLQSHYDMVCVGDAPNIQIINEDGFIKARNSTLGADNGIGLCIMLEALKKFNNIECLFTANEEVGLLGANNLNLDINSTNLLNIDSENENYVIIGCAASLMLQITCKVKQNTNKKKYLYEIQSKGYKGGHSGIDIIKNIPSAISDLALFLFKNKAKLISFNGGERTNSISVNAKALFYCDEDLQSNENFIINKLEYKDYRCFDDDFLAKLASFKQGVLSYNQELQIVKTSVNLATVKHKDDEFYIEIFARSEDSKELDEVFYKTKAHFLNYKVELISKDEPWQPVVNNFTKDVLKHLQEFVPNAKMTSIHAGLECGVLMQKNPKLKCASIGPNILNPHSIYERCEIKSIEKITNCVFNLIKSYKGE